MKVMRLRTICGRVGAVTLLAACLVVRSASAGPIHTQWTFENSVPATAGPHVPEVGTGLALGSHASAATVYSNPVGNGSNESFSSNDWAIGDYYQFETSTLGEAGVTLSWSQTRSSTGPSNFDLQYSTDFISFNTAVSYVVEPISWSSVPANFQPDSVFSADLSAITALDNQATVWFRLTATAAPGAAGGTNRVDDFTVRVVPEPGTIVLLLLMVGTGLGVVRTIRSRQ